MAPNTPKKVRTQHVAVVNQINIINLPHNTVLVYVHINDRVRSKGECRAICKQMPGTFSLEDPPPITGTYLRCTAFFCLIASLQCMGESPHGTESWTFRTGKLTTPLTVEMSPPGAPRGREAKAPPG